MSKIGDALRSFWVPKDERATSLSYMLGDMSRLAQSSNPGALINQNTAFRNSVWWACLLLRSNVEMMMTPNVYRPAAGGFATPVTSPGMMFDEPWPGIDITEFRYGMAMDKARYGNAVGIIRARNANGVVMQVEPVSMDDATATMSGRLVKQWKIGNTYYAPQDIWHEKAYTLNGFGLGMSPLANAAYTMGIYSSAQQFAIDWFQQGQKPRGQLKNIGKSKLSTQDRQNAKEEFKASTAFGDLFVVGNEWEWTPYAQDAMSTAFLEQQEASNRDVCRYLGAPASMVDVETTTGNITYANITQANLQWLITQMNATATRNERYWSKMATPKPWTVKLDRDTLLEMDPVTRQTVFAEQVTSMIRVPSEVRALDNLPPYTDEQLTELEIVARLRKPPPAGTPLDPSAPPIVVAPAGTPPPEEPDPEKVPAA